MSGKIDLSDLTLVCALRIDSRDRLDNLLAVIGALEAQAENHQFIVIENAPTPTLESLSAHRGVSHVHVAQTGPFHRTRLLNHGLRHLAATRLVASYDVDVIVHPDALRSAVQALRDRGGVASPFNGTFIDVRGSARRELMQALGSRDACERAAEGRDSVRVNANSVGGVVMFDAEAFRACGGYNENMVSWGWEDWELYSRCQKLEIPWRRIESHPLLHLSHRRGQDSGVVNPFFRANYREYRRTARLSPADLRKTVAAGGLVAPACRAPRWDDRLESGLRNALATSWAWLTNAKRRTGSRTG